MSRLFSSQEIIRILENHGFVQVGQKGSHIKLRKENKTVIVPHPKKEIPIGTFHSILRQSGMKKEDFEK
ncbi:MAG: type II toxin-antitoxin system HicA family toxin [Nanoarchaeota archaeon]|nr:type II toxin-antitoxin system HicA family toxin [Nanoarchaeota archaeon]MBU4494382.1 type II toxin-antitoxin system HicA family toxin [Acidobacteriota bacterium]MCG2815106.1 type II toxin-antitoxin system HicA family toxin [Candidatus Aminicenantes bacterium]